MRRDARVTKNETLVRRGKKWFRYDAFDYDRRNHPTHCLN